MMSNITCRACNRQINKAGLQPHAAKHKREYRRLTGIQPHRYDYVIALLNPGGIHKDLAGWVSLATGQTRLTNYTEWFNNGDRILE